MEVIIPEFPLINILLAGHQPALAVSDPVLKVSSIFTLIFEDHLASPMGLIRLELSLIVAPIK